MKPTELYHNDAAICRGLAVRVTGIERLRPSEDSYKKPGAERYILTVTGGGVISSISCWSDEDVPDMEWPPDHPED